LTLEAMVVTKMGAAVESSCGGDSFFSLSSSFLFHTRHYFLPNMTMLAYYNY
jgi:hypothetical protein